MRTKSQAASGLRPSDLPVHDELDFLKNYPAEDVKKIWDECMPKTVEVDPEFCPSCKSEAIGFARSTWECFNCNHNWKFNIISYGR